MSKKMCTGFVVAAFIAVSGVAAEELTLRSQSRLINTETAIVVPDGNFEISLGMDYLSYNGRRLFSNNWGKTQRPKARLYNWELTLRAGIADNMDAFISTAWVDIKDRSYPYGDKYGRGLDDVTVGIKYALVQQNDFFLSYQPSLTIPARQYAPETGRLGPGNNFWSFDQTVAATHAWEDFSGSMAVTQCIPFGEGRHHYSTTFLEEQRRTRGTTAFDTGVVYTKCPIVQPLVELNYMHEWISKGNDSDVIATTVGARAQIGEIGQLMVGLQYPLAGRNCYRGRTVNLGFVANF